MASKYDWEFIRPLDQTAAIANMASGNQQINAGLQAIGNSVTGYADAMKQRNTDEILNALYQAQTSADLPNAMQAVQALQQQRGRGYDQTAIRNAIDTRGATLGQRDLQAINLQQAQAAQAAIPQLNQANAAEAIRQGASPDVVNALSTLGIDASGTINRLGANAQSDTRDARDYKDKRADILYNRTYQENRDKVGDARADRDYNFRVKTDQRDYDFKVDESNWQRGGDLSKENPASSGYSTDANGNIITVSNGGVSRLDAYGALSGYVDKVVGAESGGNNRAQNTESSAGGAGQFIDSTWVAMLRKYKPELARGKSDKQLIGMKYDGALSREMTAAYGRENAEGLRKAGFQPTDGNLYLAHFAGLGGARSLLRANPNASAESVLGKDAADRNGKIIRGKTVGQVINWAYNNVNKQSSNASKATQAIGPIVPQAAVSKVTAGYQDALAKLETDYNVQGAKDQVKGSLAATGKNVDTWAASNRGKDKTWFTSASDLAAMAKNDSAFNRLPESAQINVLNGAFAKMNDVNFAQYVPDGDLKKFISRESQNYQKERVNQHTQAKNAVFEQSYQNMVQAFQAAGAKPPTRDSFRQMVDPQQKAAETPKPKPANQLASQASKIVNNATSRLPATVAKPAVTKQESAMDKQMREREERKKAEWAAVEKRQAKEKAAREAKAKAERESKPAWLQGQQGNRVIGKVNTGNLTQAELDKLIKNFKAR